MATDVQPRPLAFDPSITEQERARIGELFPELEWIQDRELREMVAKIWAHAWRIGPWKDPADAFTVSYKPRDNLVAHTREVVRVSRQVAGDLTEFSALSFNMDVLVAAALLHDAGKLIEFEPGPDKPVKSKIGQTVHHATVGAQWALEGGLPTEVAHAIYAHTPVISWAPATREALIVQMVDHTLAEVTRLVTADETRRA